MLAIFIMAVMCLAIVPPAKAGHTSAPPTEWVAYYDDFEAYFAGYAIDDCFPWLVCANWKEYPDVAPSRYLFAAEGDNTFVSDPPVASSDPIAHYTPAAYDGYLSSTSTVGSFRALLRTDSTTSWYNPWVMLTDSSKIDPTTKQILWYQSSVIVRMGGDGNLYAYGSFGARNLGPYPANEWITLDIDLNSNGTYDVCVDGKPRYRGIPFYSAPTSGINTIALWSTNGTTRTNQAAWDNLLLAPQNMDFCLDYDPAPVEQDYWNFTGVGDLYSDDQVRKSAVDSFADCIRQVNEGRKTKLYPYHGCPLDVAGWEDIIRKKLADAAQANADILPDIERPREEAPKPIARPDVLLQEIPGVYVPSLSAVDGPLFPDADCCTPIPGPEAPAPLAVRTLPGPTLDMPELPEVEAEEVTLVAPETPGTTDVVVPLRDHDFEMDWTVSLTPEKLLDLVTPSIPDLPVVTGLPVDPSQPVPKSSPAMPDPDVEMPPPRDTVDYLRWADERRDLIDWLEENSSAPDVRSNALLPPLVFEVHTESRGQVKRTPALPLVPALINVDNNPTTGLLGYDIAVRISFTPLLNEVRMNVTRLAPWERNMPDMWEPMPDNLSDIVPDDVPMPIDVELVEPYPGGVIPGTPLDLTAYVIAPIPMPWPVETMVTQNPENILVGAAGFTTGGNDAPWAMEVAVAADSLLPIHPNTRFTLTMSSWEALDNLTLLGGVADAVYQPGDENDLTDVVGPVVQNLSAIRPLPAWPEPAAEAYGLLVNSTAFRVGYEYRADNATLASVSFQPPPGVFTVDVALPTNEDENTVVAFESESSTDVRVVITDERDLLSSAPRDREMAPIDEVTPIARGPSRDVVNVRADKFPTELLITIHNDPYLPATQIDYEGEHAIGRLHVVTGTDVVFPEDGPDWNGGSFAFNLEEGRIGSADDVFHLNVSDLPKSLAFRTENGDIRLEAEAPIGRVAVTSASGVSPILPEGGDGLYYEQNGALTRIGLVIHGVEGFQAITSEPAQTFRWDMVGDQSFAVNVSLGDDWTGTDVRALVSNLPPQLMFATDAASFAAMENSNAIYNIDAYVISHGTGFEAELHIADLPEALDARFNFTAGELAMRAAQPIGDILATARLPGSDLSTVRLHVEDLPSFDVAWSVEADNISATFDAEGDGIGLLEFQGGGDVLLSIPSLATTDHAFLLEGAHPLAPTAIGARIVDLQHVSADIGPTAYRFRTEHARPAPLTIVLDRPELSAMGRIEPVPATVEVRVEVGDEIRATYEATEVIDRVAMWIWSDGLEGYLDARLIPNRVDVSLVDDPSTGGLRGDIRTQGRLGSLQAQVRHPDSLFGTPWRNAYARLEGVPEEVTVRVAEGHVSFEAQPGALTLVEAAVTNGSQLTMLDGDHVRLIGNESGDTVEASARVTGLSFLSATFRGEMDIRIENERARPFTAVADYPHFGIYGVVQVQDLPAEMTIQTNLMDRHLYEASSIISRIDAYGRIGTMEAWLGLEDVPARVKVLVNATEGAVDAFVLSSSRLQEARVDIRDPNGIFGTSWKAAYAKVQGLPEVLAFRLDRTGAEFSTEHDMIALVEGAASSEMQLYTVEGDHLVYVNETRRLVECDLKLQCPPPLPGLLASFRLRGLEGARVGFAPDEVSARLETKDGRSFVALVSLQGLRACLTIGNLPTVMEFRSDLKSSHVYDATSIISDLTLQARVNTTQLYFGLKDLPRHIVVSNNVTDAGGDVRVWMDSNLQDILLDVYDPVGLGGTEWQRARVHIESIPRELKLTWDETGADFGTGDDQIGLIEFWAADTYSLTELAGDHVRYEDRCQSQGELIREFNFEGRLGFCGKAISARLTGLKAARFSMTDADGLNARLETQGPRVFRAMYHQQGDWSGVGAELVVNELPAVLAVRSDLETRFVYEASGIVDEITVRGQLWDNETNLGAAARLQGLPARIEVDQSFGAEGGSVTYLASSPIRLIEIEAYDWMGLGDTDFTRAVARVRELPSFLQLTYTPSAEGLLASFQTAGEGIGLLEAGLTTGYGLPVTTGNGVYLDKNGASLTATGRIAGFSGASVRVEGDSLAADLKFQQAAPFESVANIDGTYAYGRIDAVPAEMSVTASLPSNIVYSASSPIESIVLYVQQPTEQKIDRILRADVTTVPQTMRVTIDEVEGIVHFTSSEAIGGIKIQAFDPEMLMGFHNVFAEVKHVPPSMRLKYNGTMQLDASEGVDSIVFQATSIGDYPVYDGSHAVIREIIGFDGQKRAGISAKITGLKFVEVAVHDGFTLAEIKLRESQSLKAYYEEWDVNKGAGTQVFAHLSNIPKEIKIQRVTGPGDGSGTILYEGSERIGNLRLAAIMSADEYYDLSLDNLPSTLSIEYKFDADTPWFARYVADAPTQVRFEMPTSMGPLELEALIQNLQFSILDVPSAVPDVSLEVSVSLFPPDVDVNIQLAWTFVIATDTDFLPNNARLSLGLFHSEDFDLAVIFTGDLLAQDWLYEASIVVNIGTDTGIEFEIETVGGHAFAQLCIGAYVRYDPWGFEDTFECILRLGGVYPEP